MSDNMLFAATVIALCCILSFTIIVGKLIGKRREKDQ